MNPRDHDHRSTTGSLRGRLAALLSAVALLTGCGPDLGECDEMLLGGDRSEQSPAPNHAQVIVQQRCASSRCHSADAQGEFRAGAPADLNFDVVPLDRSTAEINKVWEGAHVVHEWRETMWAEIDEGRMPPPAPAGAGELAAADKESVRNWLACGAPVIATPIPSSQGDDWSSIYADLINRCAGCHAQGTAAAGGGFVLGDPGDPCGAHERLVGMPAVGTACQDSGATLVVAGMPDASLLVEKISVMMPSCGALMPATSSVPLSSTDPEIVDRLRTWIADGAPKPAECE